jgi:DNA-binding transcriptional regulator YiaG
VIVVQPPFRYTRHARKENTMAETTTIVATAPLYATGTTELCARVLAARELVGRPTLAAHLGISQSACWRWERNRVHPGSELKALQAAGTKGGPLDKLPAGKPVGRATKIEAAKALVRKHWGDLPEDFRTELTDLLS